MTTIPVPLGVTCTIFSKENFVGEIFKATLKLSNLARYSVERVIIAVDLILPSRNSVPLAVHRGDVSSIGPNQHHNLQIERVMTEEGKYMIQVYVTFTDFTREMREFKPAKANFFIHRALEEVSRKVQVLPIVPPASVRYGSAASVRYGSAVDPNIGDIGDDDRELQEQHKILFNIALQCKSSLPIVVKSLRFIPSDPMLVEVLSIMPILEWEEGKCRTTAEENPNEGAPTIVTIDPSGSFCLSDGSILTRGAETFYYEDVLNITVVLKRKGKSLLQTVGAVEAGVLEWEWKRGEKVEISGIDRTRAIKLTKLPTAVAPYAGDQGTVTLKLKSIYPPDPKVGELITLHLVATNIVNNSTPKTASGRDISLVVHIGKLLPSFSYTGPLSIPLGVLKYGKDINFKIDITALQPGPHVIQGAMELRDTVKQEIVLWPQFPFSLSQSGGVHSDTVCPTPTWPPQLCDVFVMPESDTDDD